MEANEKFKRVLFELSFNPKSLKVFVWAYYGDSEYLNSKIVEVELGIDFSKI